MKIAQTQTELGSIRSESLRFEKFKDSEGGENLNVDGSVNPITFEANGDSNKNILLERISFIIGANEKPDLEKFGNVDSLPIGISFGNTLFKDNGDVMLIATSLNVTTAGNGANTYTIIAGYLDYTDAFGGNAPIFDFDKLKITINDDLSALPYFKVSCQYIILD